MMQLVPITMGPAMAKMVAFGCTIVPVNHERRTQGQPSIFNGNTCADGNVAFELDILTYHGLGMDRKFISAESIVLQTQIFRKKALKSSHRGHALGFTS